jgi:hypothetical protein
MIIDPRDYSFVTTAVLRRNTGLPAVDLWKSVPGGMRIGMSHNVPDRLLETAP